MNKTCAKGLLCSLHNHKKFSIVYNKNEKCLHGGVLVAVVVMWQLSPGQVQIKQIKSTPHCVFKQAGFVMSSSIV